MKPFMKTVPCTISTLSPVHIGCGEDYYPTNYVIDGGFLHHFSEEGLMAALNPSELDQLVGISELQNDRGIKELQRFVYKKSKELANQATQSIPVTKGIESFYMSRIKGEDKNKLEIARHTFNPYSQTPYFPGSSIKGSIRTAILNSLNEANSLQSKLDELRIKDRYGKPVIVSERTSIPKYANDELQKNLLGYQAISDNPQKGMKGDPLRLLKISDATYSNIDNLTSAEIRFAVDRKKEPSKKQTELYQILECLPAHRSQSLLFDMTLLSDTDNGFRWTLFNICNSCNEFFVRQLEKELEMLKQLNYCSADWAHGLEKLLADELQDAFENQQAFLLRIGQHGGAESNILEGLRHIHIPQHKKHSSKPTTIWLAGDNKDAQHELLPFGWVLVEIDACVLNKTYDFLKTHAASDYARQQKQALKAQQQAEAAEQERKKQAEIDRKAQELEDKLINFSELAQAYFKQADEHDWENNKDTFLQNGEIENWLTQLESNFDQNILTDIVRLLNKHITGLLDNPDKVKGRRAEFVYKDRQRKIAQRIKTLQAKP
jgi:CRISPR-associated protein Csm5